MRAKLTCRSGPLRGLEVEIGREATLGRAPESTVVLDHERVSGSHARIVWDEGRGTYLVEDLGSRNGTEVDGAPVTHREPLTGLHVVTLAGEVDLIFQTLPGGAEAGEAGATRIDREAPALPAPLREDDRETIDAVPEGTMIGREAFALPSSLADAVEPESANGGGTYVLEFGGPAGERATIALREGVNPIGRAAGAEPPLDSPDLSRRHAELVVAGSRVTVRDLGSRNHTYVDGERIGRAVEVRPGARLRFGGVEALLVRR